MACDLLALNANVPYLEVALRSRNGGEPYPDGVTLEDSSQREFVDEGDRVVDVVAFEAHSCEFPPKRKPGPRSKSDVTGDPSFESSKPRGCDAVVLLFSAAPIAQG